MPKQKKKIFKLSEKEYEVVIRALRRENLDPQELQIFRDLNKRMEKIIFVTQLN
jgi:hypothetical protein